MYAAREPLAPAAIARVRAASLRCFAQACSCKEAVTAVRLHTWTMASAAVPYLSTKQPLAVQQAATDALLGVAKVDTDSVWLLLYDVVYNAPQKTQCATAPAHSTVHGSKDAITSRGAIQPTFFKGDRESTLPNAQAPLPAGVCANAHDGTKGDAGECRLPSLSAIWLSLASGPPGRGREWPVTTAIAAECCAHAAALLSEVEGMGVAWHSAGAVE